jgi:hypothetical protein
VSLRSAKVLSCVVGRRGQKDRGGVHCWHLPFCVRYTHCCVGFLYRRWWLGIANVFFLIKLKSSVFLSAWAPLTSYVSPAPAGCHALTWLAGGIWALYSAFATRVFLVRRGISIQCQILCVVSSTLLLLHAHPFFLWFFFILFCLLCGLYAVDERDGLRVARETGWAFRGCLPMGF